MVLFRALKHKRGCQAKSWITSKTALCPRRVGRGRIAPSWQRESRGEETQFPVDAELTRGNTQCAGASGGFSAPAAPPRGSCWAKSSRKDLSVLAATASVVRLLFTSVRRFAA